MRALRLGDDIDDYCIKCKRLTNHVIVALLDEEPAKLRCRSCYHEHAYLHEKAPPKKASGKKTGAKKTAGKKVAKGGPGGDET